MGLLTTEQRRRLAVKEGVETEQRPAKRRFPSVELPRAVWPHLDGTEDADEMRRKVEAHSAGDFIVADRPYLCEACLAQGIEPERLAYAHCSACSIAVCDAHFEFLALVECDFPKGVN